ncbi:manganese efflux pump [Methanoculleus sp. FWC-SCC1]|uniref:Putative manganese efflux pump MntP n=1 Tax=Methanoculleus frigidifontis TaxID=2584085 RepID=A0ABT8M977_9EURY|nr:manganese efflux pump MntP family protein [Methanoculleus sp. FWC-SCC1]MDN7024488.1 manganese efflux pump [Methanoculleus sp. FWC-SCC1]
MEFLVTSTLIGIGLAMDCFAVSLAIGATHHAARMKTALLIAGFFGFFQFAMALVGWVLGAGFTGIIAAYGHWIAFLLLALIGGKMLWESITGVEEEAAAHAALTLGSITLLAIATSIDSLAAGISFAVLGYVPLVPAVIIGVISWLFAFTGVFSGQRLERVLGRRVEVIGGAILILIGLRIVLENTVFA